MIAPVIDRKTSSAGVLPSLWAFAFLSYLLRTNIAVAQQYMARELHLNDIQVGYVFSAFLIGYTIFQVPAGALGDRFGARLVLTLSGVICGVATLLTGLMPGLLFKGSLAVLLSLLVIRFALGAGQAATYPVAMIAVSDWFAASEHAVVNSLVFTGSTLGAAFAPPLIAYLMNAAGWHATFYVTAIPPVALAIFWLTQTKGRTHSSTEERTSGRVRFILRKSLLFLCLSYFLYCYAISIFVYWLFKYLVDVRHLSVVGSGWATSLPWIVATATVPLAGYLSRHLSARIGMLAGRRLLATSCLVLSAILMFIGAGAQSISAAVAAIALSVGLLFSTEASYWSTAIALAPDDAGASGGLMNFAGNLGGVASTLLVPVLVHFFGWFQALLSGSAFAILGAAFWFLI